MKRLDLSNNSLSGVIPSEIGQFRGASILLQGNDFSNTSTAPLSLCTLRSGVEKFDLVDDRTLCPIERNALSDFYDSAKGAEWTNVTKNNIKWLNEYASYCDWHGVTCDDDKRVKVLELSNNGLSGRLSESIGKLTSIQKLDLSDNDIKVMSICSIIMTLFSFVANTLTKHRRSCTQPQGPIPTEIGLLSNLTYLRLSYNAFTGKAPDTLTKLTQLQLLQLQSNRITEMPNIPQVDESVYKNSTFVTDCGVPSAFDEAMECENCTMCCE